MNATTEQPDLLAGAGPKTIEKPRGKRTAAMPAKNAGTVAKKERQRQAAKKATGTAVAVDDPKKRQQLAQQKTPEPDALLSAIIRASADPACDPAKMRELVAIKRERDHDAAKAAFDDAFVALQAELPSIRRDGKIEVRKKDASGERNGPLQQSTPYATFNAIHEAIKPLLVKYGFGLSFSTAATADGRLIVKTTLSRKGHSIFTEFPLPAEVSGSKNNVQGWGSSQSYGKRYGTIALLNIVSHDPKDADTDGHDGTFVRSKDGLAQSTEVETISDEQLSELNARMTKCKVPLDKVLKHYAIAKLDKLPANLLAHALKACDDYADNQKRVQQDETFPADRVSTGGPRGSYRR